MKEYCVKRKGRNQWELVLKAVDLESAAKEFIESNDVAALDELIIVENKAFGRIEQANFIAHEVLSRPEWSEFKDMLADAPAYKEMRRIAPSATEPLDKLRNRSSYRLLRKVISDLAVIVICLTVIYAIIAICVILSSRGASGWMVLSVLVNVVIALAVVYIIKNLSIVLIDISDSLIIRNEDKKRD